MLGKLFSTRREDRPAPAIPPGRRVYAVGDVHGRLDLLRPALAALAAEEEARPPAEVTLVFLGDLIDRGPDSAGVVELVRELAEGGRVRTLLGNHEEVFLLACDGDLAATQLFCRIGGRETLLSYGLPADAFERLDYPEVSAALAALVPRAHRDFLARGEALVQIGDYAFVHAGVRPGVPFARQTPHDLRWIRHEFLAHDRAHEKVVVHGHTPARGPEFRTNRIGIDTGAFATGRLTVLGLEGSEQWIVEA